MTPTALLELADRLDGTRQLVRLLELASEAACDNTESRDAMVEATVEIQRRLEAISAELKAVRE